MSNSTSGSLTPLEAYEAMLAFLERLQQMTGSDDLAVFLGGFQLREDGGTMDPAAWKDWLDAVAKVQSRR
jgi:hypothetical protein